MRHILAFCLLMAVHLAVYIPASLASTQGPALRDDDEWTGWGGSIYNNRASNNKHISSSTLKNASVHCQIPHKGGVSATPILSNGIAYYPTWGGSFVALDHEKCQIKWEINVTSIIINFASPTPLQQLLIHSTVAGGLLASRTSPQIDVKNSVLYFATQLNALVVAVDLATGSLLGIKQLNSHPAAIVTLSPTLYNDILYIGVASAEELVAGLVPGYKCCSFVGNIAALSFDRYSRTFRTVWDLDMLPTAAETNQADSGRWSGVGVWGSQPAIDKARGRVFFATGNVYSVPDAYVNCTDDAHHFDPSKPQPTLCLPDRIWQNAVIALDLLTGKPAWLKRFGPLDVWNLACGTNGTVTNPVSCPGTPGPDSDFGMAPAYVPAADGQHGEAGLGRDLLVVGRRAGTCTAWPPTRATCSGPRPRAPAAPWEV
jgi:glucose dehydrogenase